MARRRRRRARRRCPQQCHLARREIDEIGLRQAFHFRFYVGQRVGPHRQHLAAELLEAGLEIAVQQPGVGRGLFVEHHGQPGLQRFDGPFSAGGGLHIVAEAGEEQVARDLARQLRRGRAGCEEHAFVFRGDGRRRQHHVGVGKADQSGDRRLLPDERSRFPCDDWRLGLPSAQMSLTGRPSTPAALLASSTASCAPRDEARRDLPARRSNCIARR